MYGDLNSFPFKQKDSEEETRAYLNEANKKYDEEDGINWAIRHLFLAALATLLGSFILVDSNRYHQDRDPHAYPELSFLGSDDPIVGVLLLGLGIAVGYRAYLKACMDSQDQALKKSEQNNATFLKGLICVLSLYGAIRFGIGLLSPDNDASPLSSMGDIYNGEAIDLGKALTMTFLYGGLFVGSAYKLMVSNSPKGPSKSS